MDWERRRRILNDLALRFEVGAEFVEFDFLAGHFGSFDRQLEFGGAEFLLDFMFEFADALAVLGDDLIGVEKLVDFGVCSDLAGCALVPGGKLRLELGDLPVFFGDDRRRSFRSCFRS